MALAEVPVNLGGESDDSACEGCFLNSSASAEGFKPCTVVNALAVVLPKREFQIAFQIVGRPDGEFARKDIFHKLPEVEDEKTSVLSDKYIKVINFLQHTSALRGLLTDNGVKRGGKRQKLNKGVLPEICAGIRNGAISLNPASLKKPKLKPEKTDKTVSTSKVGTRPRKPELVNSEGDDTNSEIEIKPIRFKRKKADLYIAPEVPIEPRVIDGDPRLYPGANCRNLDLDLFFPERGESTKEAKEVCRGCVIREDCLEYALSNGEKFGIWGGLSERERRRIRRARSEAQEEAEDSDDELVQAVEEA